MNPFVVLNVSVDVTAEQVEERYNRLVLKYTPERSPRRFALVRAAYERLNSPRKIQKELLFGYDETGRALTEELDIVPAYIERRRLGCRRLAALLRDCRLKKGPARQQAEQVEQAWNGKIDGNKSAGRKLDSDSTR